MVNFPVLYKLKRPEHVRVTAASHKYKVESRYDFVNSHRFDHLPMIESKKLGRSLVGRAARVNAGSNPATSISGMEKIHNTGEYINERSR